MAQSGHVDTFTRDNLPPRDQWPEFKFDLPELQYPERLNCVTEFVDRWVPTEGGRIAIISPAETLTYAQLAERINRIANVLTRDLGLVPGNRVLLRAPNNPMAIAVYLAVIKAGGVVVATMPLLRAKELSYAVTKEVNVFTTAQFQAAGKSTNREGGKASVLDLGQSVIVALGVSYSF